MGIVLAISYGGLSVTIPIVFPVPPCTLLFFFQSPRSFQAAGELWKAEVWSNHTGTIDSCGLTRARPKGKARALAGRLL